MTFQKVPGLELREFRLRLLRLCEGLLGASSGVVSKGSIRTCVLVEQQVYEMPRHAINPMGSTSEPRETGNVHTYTYIHTHTHIYIYRDK